MEAVLAQAREEYASFEAGNPSPSALAAAEEYRKMRESDD
jgi:hypothetical protein